MTSLLVAAVLASVLLAFLGTLSLLGGWTRAGVVIVLLAHLARWWVGS